MSDDLSKRRALRIKITKASRQLIVLSLEQLLSLQYEYDIVSELCLLENPQDYDEQRSKDDLYKQKIEALIAFERTKNQLASISIEDDELASEFNNVTGPSSTSINPRGPLSSQGDLYFSLSNPIRINNMAYPTSVGASDLLTFDGNVMN